MSPRPLPEPEGLPDPGPALSMAASGQFVEALHWLELQRAGAVEPDVRARLASAHGEVGRAALDAGHFEVAESAFESAVRLAPDWADLHYQHAQSLLRRGRRGPARDALSKALALNPRYRAAAVERALLDAREGRIAEAMDALRAMAREVEPLEPAAFRRGMERLGQADFEDAAELLKRSLTGADPRLDEQLRNYQALVHAGEAARALHALRAAIAAHPGYPDLHFLIGSHELQDGAVDDAIESFAHALELNPDYHAARVQLARALDRLGDTQAAAEQAALVLAHEPGHREAAELHEALQQRRRRVRTPA